MPDLNAYDMDAAKLQVRGTARSMGIAVADAPERLPTPCCDSVEPRSCLRLRAGRLTGRAGHIQVRIHNHHSLDREHLARRAHH